MAKFDDIDTKSIQRYRNSLDIKGGAGTDIKYAPDAVKLIINNATYWFKLVKPKTNQELKERIALYFERVEDTGELPSLEKLGLALGVTHETLMSWERDITNKERSSLVAQAREALAAIDAELVSSGMIPQVSYIFRSKNFYGMQDRTEVFIVGNQQLEPTEDPKQTASKYINDTDDNVEVEVKDEIILDTDGKPLAEDNG
jgi:hypothetical protein